MTAPNDTGSQQGQGSTNDAQGDNDTTNDTQGASGDAGTSNGASTDDTTNVDTVTRAEFDSLFKRMQAADTAKSAAENKLKELERKDQSDLQKAQTDLEDTRKLNEQLSSKLNEMALQNAFLTDNKHSWADPGDALRLLNMEGVEVKDGVVTGLAPAIEKLAKDKPYLLKKEGDGTDSSGASGSATNGKRKGSDPNDKKDYSGRFPALKNG